jgi:hypothetical protein
MVRAVLDEVLKDLLVADSLSIDVALTFIDDPSSGHNHGLERLSLGVCQAIVEVSVACVIHKKTLDDKKLLFPEQHALLVLHQELLESINQWYFPEELPGNVELSGAVRRNRPEHRLKAAERGHGWLKRDFLEPLRQIVDGSGSANAEIPFAWPYDKLIS